MGPVSSLHCINDRWLQKAGYTRLASFFYLSIFPTRTLGPCLVLCELQMPFRGPCQSDLCTIMRLYSGNCGRSVVYMGLSPDCHQLDVLDYEVMGSNFGS